VMLTNLATTNYEAPASSPASEGERMSIWQLPKLLWAGVALFSVNAIIGIGMLYTPDIQPDMFGHEVRSVHDASSKPSPFTEVVDTRKKKVQTAAKLRPVVVETAPLEQVAMESAQPAPTTLDIPRVSKAYQLDLHVRTQPVIYENVAPRRGSERDKTFVVIN
jgi:hypothetical protein